MGQDQGGPVLMDRHRRSIVAFESEEEYLSKEKSMPFLPTAMSLSATFPEVSI
jgi:hypothetical protein